MASSSRRIRLVSATLKFSSLELVIWLWISLNLATLVLSQHNFYTSGRYGKRVENDAPAGGLFLSGSRYGRNGRGNIKNSNSVTKVLEISPRVDRFFMGSRYGKRAHMQSYNVASLKRFEAALNYLDRIQHVQLIKREGEINYDKSDENDDNKEENQGPKNNLVL
ncbi:uncharacterized protein LOC117178794 [Belonocnema kinseyi]|uniref:uncharacterized protein LOC117178794 n=1 Tax=Belonocnema kinseyi TaxID=2817044 RepID=UPI00143CF111|nr:uncharacterized protein LOC117178794 [Belonocnema kinseyi]XP_033226161.1 uncharacterized protein LOC117178794 [Belonocnema kinseyi]